MKLPRHLAIIMDGNGRWAQSRGRPRSFGHIKGTRVAKKIITECADLGIKHLTLYAFSSENWFRPQAEVSLLMSILKRYLKKETENLVKKNIRFHVIGDLTNIPTDVLESIEKSIERTSRCTGLQLTFALGYGSRQEITNAIQKIAQLVVDQKIAVADIDESMVSEYLSTYPTPDPDLIIRTSGEKRLSNFLMWQASYSEFYFTDVLWPDFQATDLMQALVSFSQRERRFGKVHASDEELHN